MHLNFSDYVTKIQVDEMSTYFETTEINIIGYGNWSETNVKGLKEFITSSFQLTYIKKGSAKVTYRDKDFFFPTGSILIYSPFEVYSATSIGDEPLEYSYIFFDVYPFAQRYKLEQHLTMQENNLFDEVSRKSYQYQFEKLNSMVKEKRPGNAFMIKLCLLSVLTDIMSARIDGLPTLGNEKELLNLVHQAIRYTDENLSSPIKLSDIAKDLGVSDSLLSKSFQKAVHTSPAKFLTQYKIGIAEQYIRQKKYSIDTIAEMLGYSSGAHFRTTYKKTLGRNP